MLESELPAGAVTLVLTDVEGSTAAWDTDTERMEEAMAMHDAIVAESVVAHGGVLIKSKGEGDSTFSVFTEAAAALDSAVDLLVTLARREFHLRVRVAIHSGDVQPRGGDYFGPVPNRAARLRALAAGGQVVVSSAAARAAADCLPAQAELVDLGLHRLRGLTAPELVFGLSHPQLEPVALLTVPAPSPSNLPAAVDTFVGRHDDRVALDKALAQRRLVTVVGPGGVGKTRLALEVSADSAHGRSGGTWLVDLGALSDPDLLATAVAQACRAPVEPGEDPIASVATALAEPALVVLDTCEHMVDASAELASRLLASVPALTILATSREPLRVPGEAVLRLDPLRTEAGPAGEPSEAARLFAERAAAADLGFDADLEHQSLVEGLCLALDGLPLAIELVAGRVGEVALEVLAADLGQRLVGTEASRRGGPERQRTLRATIEWSYNRLAPVDQGVLRRLAAFTGGWPAAASAKVCADNDLDPMAVPAIVEGLTRCSLVARSVDRLRLLDTIRAFAAERLEDADERAAAEGGHLAWAVEHAEALDDEALLGESGWMDVMAADQANFLQALEVAVSRGEAESAQRLATAQCNFWQESVFFEPGRQATATALALGGSGPVRARALAGDTMLALRLGDIDAANAQIDEALAIVEGEVSPVAAEVYAVAAAVAGMSGRDEVGRERARAAADLARQVGDRHTLSVALHNLGATLGGVNNHVERLTVMREAAEVERSFGSLSGHARIGLAIAERMSGRLAVSLALLDEVESFVTGFARVLACVARGEVELVAGRMEAALASARQGRSLAELLGLEEEAGEAVLLIARALDASPKADDDVDALFREGIATLGNGGFGRCRLAERRARLGDVTGAEDLLAETEIDPNGDHRRNLAEIQIELTKGNAAEALDRVVQLGHKMAAAGVHEWERDYLRMEVIALEALGRDDDAAKAASRLAEMVAAQTADLPPPLDP